MRLAVAPVTPPSADQFILAAQNAYHLFSNAAQALDLVTGQVNHPIAGAFGAAISQASAAITTLTPFIDGSDDDIAGISITDAKAAIATLSALLASAPATPTSILTAVAAARADFQAARANLTDGLEIFPPKK